MITIYIDGLVIKLSKSMTILDAAIENNIYIPHLCWFPGLGSSKGLRSAKIVYRGGDKIIGDPDEVFEGCHLCLVEIKGKDGLIHACSTTVEEGMEIFTNSPKVLKKRREYFAELLTKHPHVCLSCDFAEGCDRKICSMNVSEEARCCWKFGYCEFQSLSLYVGFDRNLPYKYKNIKILDDNLLFARDFNLCVSCLRCIKACRDVAGQNAIGFLIKEGEVVVGTMAPTLKESGCRFCLACVEVCPTGALRDKKPGRLKSRVRSEIQPAIFPPVKDRVRFLLSEKEIQNVPEKEGVYRLWDENGDLYQITGTENLREALLEESKEKEMTFYFDFEEEMMFTSRENQLIQKYLKKYGKLPPGNGEDDDLF